MYPCLDGKYCSIQGILCIIDCALIMLIYASKSEPTEEETKRGKASSKHVRDAEDANEFIEDC